MKFIWEGGYPKTDAEPGEIDATGRHVHACKIDTTYLASLAEIESFSYSGILREVLRGKYLTLAETILTYYTKPG